MSASSPIDRRRVLQVLGAGGSGMALLACGGRLDPGDDGTPSDPDPNALDPGTPGTDDDAATTGDNAVDPGSCGGGTDYGAAADLPASTYKITGSGRASIIVGHDDGGFFAMTGACSHSGCKLQQRTTEWYCNCHNGHFQLNGDVKSVPRNRPLVHYALSICGGRLLVDTGSQVPSSTRVMG